MQAQDEADKFLWLEEIDGKKQMSWVLEHNKKTVDYLSSVKGYDEIYKFAYEILTSDEQLVYPDIHGEHIYNFWQDGEHPRGLLRRTGFHNFIGKNPDWEPVLDIDSLSKTDTTDWTLASVYFAPRNSNKCIIGLSEGGSDAACLKEFDLESKQFISDGFNVGEAKTDITWIDDDHVYISSDFGDGTLTTSGYARFVKRWERGTRLEDAEVVFEASAEDVGASSVVFHNQDDVHEFIVHFIDIFSFRLFYVTDTALIQLPLPSELDFNVFSDQMIICPSVDWITMNDTIKKGSVVIIALEDLKMGNINVQKLFEPTIKQTVEDISVTSNSILINIIDNINSRVIKYKYIDGNWRSELVDLPSGGSIDIVDASNLRPEYFLTYESFTQPPTLYIEKNDGNLIEVMSMPSYFDASGCEVKQYEAVSADGTAVPYFIIQRKDIVADGSNPVIMYGYGGFQISEIPYYSATTGKLWVEKGRAYVIANIRGGGEFGPGWHKAAIKENKQKSYDDFIAVAEDLIRRKITTPSGLGITGGSNGGLLVGAVMLQRPDLFNAVVSKSPLLDMQRYSKLLAGQSWVAEYGDPDVPEQWEYIKKYSPYQNVVPGKNTLPYCS